ncbi:DUF6766 family protein [Desertimonas flava]|uniref:DUF6766 family protein n=1 Tax=Desertimonas flava TaxID=2064846 RepID=UPI0013C503A3|nr:DUF6766 family protein [Desertimonas flava]
MGAVMMVVSWLIVVASLGWLLSATVRSIRNERTAGRSAFREFGLSFALITLFFASWIGHLITQWQEYTDEQSAQGASTKLGDFVAQFGQATLENWQSEFLQLFAFISLSALYIHKGSAESKDGTEKLEASLRRIEEHLGILPDDAPDEPGEEWKLPETSLQSEDRVHEAQSSTTTG